MSELEFKTLDGVCVSFECGLFGLWYKRSMKSWDNVQFTRLGLALGILSGFSLVSYDAEIANMVIGFIFGFAPFGIYMLYLGLFADNDWPSSKYIGALIAVTLPQVLMHIAASKAPLGMAVAVIALIVLSFPLAILGGWIGSIFSKKK